MSSRLRDEPLRQRRSGGGSAKAGGQQSRLGRDSTNDDPLSKPKDVPQGTSGSQTMSAQNSTQWLFYAIASGGCAALNGVFAKLTTTQLTTTWATGISHLFGLSEPSSIVELLIRGFFFLMNLAFNAVMWGLFTRALTLATSTVRVSIINTSANFMLTAVLGALIFRESLPALWWLGAIFLVAGSVIIGRREEGKVTGAAGTAGSEPTVVAQEPYQDEPDAPPAPAEGVQVVDAGSYSDSIELERKVEGATRDDEVAEDR